MSVDFSEKHMALFQFNEKHSLGSRQLIEGLQLLKDKSRVDEFDGRAVRPNLKGSKDTNEIIWKPAQFDGIKSDTPIKPCLFVPKEEGSSERVEVRKAKSVHFADSCGLALTSVATLFDNEEDLFAFKNFSRSRGFADRNSYPSFGNKKREFKDKQKSKLLNFVQPVTLPDFHEKLATNNVSLENVVLREFSIFGTVAVKNLDYEKNVYLRYTINNWKSCQNAQGVYVTGSSTGRSDTFSFEIPMTDVTEECNVEFCVCFETKSGSFWDNNNNQNYKVLFHPSATSRSCPIVRDDPDGFALGSTSRRFAGFNM